MAVDAARQHQAIRGVDHPRAATIRPSRMPTSALKVSDAVATVPPPMIMS